MPDPVGLLVQLKALDALPAQQTALAIELLETHRSSQVVQAAAEVLEGHPDRAAGPALRKQYDNWFDRRDPGGLIRSALLRALRPVADVDDIPRFERALWTYEFRSGDEIAGSLRAQGLLGTDDLDAELGAYHATRLLSDHRTSSMSGEPAITAARVLGARGNGLPLYGYVLQGSGGIPEVTGECLRGLVCLPAVLLQPLVDKYLDDRSETILAGLFDLILGHPAGLSLQRVVTDFLKPTQSLDMYRYIVSAAVAGRRTEWWPILLAHAVIQREPRRVAILLETLPLMGNTSELRAALETLRSQGSNSTRRSRRS